MKQNTMVIYLELLSNSGKARNVKKTEKTL
jgi:hypothetical protein